MKAVTKALLNGAEIDINAAWRMHRSGHIRYLGVTKTVVGNSLTFTHKFISL